MVQADTVRCRDSVALGDQLVRYESEVTTLPGIAVAGRRSGFVEQLVDSGHISDSLRALAVDHVDGECSDPSSESFNPLCAAVSHHRRGDIEEACWLVFLATAFDLSPVHGWDNVAAVYRRGDDDAGLWDWDAASAEVGLLREWLQRNRWGFAAPVFGNHRKFESLKNRMGVGRTIESYIAWVLRAGSHQARLDEARHEVDPFDALFRSMAGVWRFGRLARFDYLCSLESLAITEFAPRKVYLRGATGPLDGARLMYGAPEGSWAGDPCVLDDRLVELEGYLNVGFDVLEDAMCGWQKHPSRSVGEPCAVRATTHSCTTARRPMRRC